MGKVYWWMIIPQFASDYAGFTCLLLQTVWQDNININIGLEHEQAGFKFCEN